MHLYRRISWRRQSHKLSRWSWILVGSKQVRYHEKCKTALNASMVYRYGRSRRKDRCRLRSPRNAKDCHSRDLGRLGNIQAIWRSSITLVTKCLGMNCARSSMMQEKLIDETTVTWSNRASCNAYCITFVALNKSKKIKNMSRNLTLPVNA